MSDKIGRVLRRASGLKIARAGSKDTMDRADPCGDQSTVRQIPDAKGGIDPFLGQTDRSVAECQTASISG